VNAKAYLGTAAVYALISFLGTTYFYNPTMPADTAAAAAAASLVPPMAVSGIMGLVLAYVLSWVSGMTGPGIKAGLVMAVSQIALVNVYYVLSGQRGTTQALASTVVLLVMHTAAGYTYGKLSAGKA
jgi:hypothetical protein